MSFPIRAKPLLSLSPFFEETTWNAALSACEKCGEWRWALELLMRHFAVGSPGVVSVNAAISACETLGEWMSMDKKGAWESHGKFQEVPKCHVKAFGWSNVFHDISMENPGMEWWITLGNFLHSHGRPSYLVCLVGKLIELNGQVSTENS